MAKVKDDYIFKLKGGEASVLECVNPFLERREPIVVFFENGQTNIKIGDGKNNYNSLPFISDTNIDINDVQGLTEILSQYEIDLENLNSKIDKIVIDKVYDPNSDNAQSGKAVSQAIAEKPGQKTPQGGIIFNDYENNVAGSKAFSIAAITAQPTVNDKYLSIPIKLGTTVEGLSDNDIVSGRLSMVYNNIGTIISVNNTTNEMVIKITDMGLIASLSQIMGTTIDCDLYNSALTTESKIKLMTTQMVDNALIIALILESTNGFSTGENVALGLNISPENFGFINSIDKTNNTVSLNMPSSATSQLNLDSIYLPKCNIRVIQKPTLGNLTLGEFSTASGKNTKALNNGSISEGKDSIASGEYAHAEGVGTFAGLISHAEGYYTEASQTGAHAEGVNTKGYGIGSHTEGVMTVSNGFAAHTEGQGSISSGIASHSEGLGTQASGQASHAEGQGSQANGENSHTEGLGCQTTPTASNSHAEGSYCQARHLNAHAEGNGTQARGEASHTEGFSTITYGPRSHAEGDETVTGVSTSSGDGYAAHAEGVRSKAAGFASHSEGQSTEAIGAESHAEGYYTEAVSDYSHTEGFYTKASGAASHAEGGNTESIGQNSHAEGFNTKAIGDYSHAEGSGNEARGNASHVEGMGTKAIGDNSHAQGYYTYAGYKNSSAAGEVTLASRKNQFVVGEYNDETTTKNSLFVVGNGEADAGTNERKGSNAFVVNKDGSAEVQKQGTTNNSVVIKSELDKVQNVATTAESIAKGRATGYVFDTIEELDAWLNNTENTSKLNLGDNLYIRAIDVPDYWWDGNAKQPLETQKVDLDSYVTENDIDQTYDPNSPNAQSGKAVNEALSVFEEIPMIDVGDFNPYNTDIIYDASYNGVYEITSITSEFDTYLDTTIGSITIYRPLYALPNLTVGSKIYIEFGEQWTFDAYHLNKLAAVKDKYLTEETLQKNYELIATIKVAPDIDGNLPTSIIFTEDSNGRPFELTDFYLSAVVGATDGSSAKIALAINNKQVFGNTNCGISTGLRQWWLNYMNFGAKGSIAIAPSWTVGSKAHATAGNGNISGFAGGVLPPLFSDYLPVTKINFYIMSGTTQTFIEGSEFKLYGVRK